MTRPGAPPTRDQAPGLAETVEEPHGIAASAHSSQELFRGAVHQDDSAGSW